MKKPTRKDVDTMIKVGIADTKKAARAATKFTKKTVRAIKKNAPTKKEVHSASRTAARVVVSDAIAAKRGAGKFAKKVVSFSKEVATGIKEGVRDARRKR